MLYVPARAERWLKISRATATMDYKPEHEDTIDLEQLRARLGKMPDRALLHYGRCSRYMCSPEASLGKPPRQVFVIQLEEARAEWIRRNPSQIVRSPTFCLEAIKRLLRHES
jgi:hypothetical protein